MRALNPYHYELITVSTGMYTKHYYAGSSRIASRIGGGFVPHKDLNDYSPVAEPDRVDLLQTTSYDHKAENLRNLWARAGECMGMSLEYAYWLDFGSFLKNTETADGERYFYHSDHLGSSAYITTEMRSIREDLWKTTSTEQNGYATQFLAYMPFGETLAEQQNGTSYYSPFKFSAKEKDLETGYSYFGARYYSPELSVWLSVDPLSDDYPHQSPYAYCSNNPVMRVDPDGRSDNEYTITTQGGEVKSVQMTGTRGGDQTDYITVVNLDRVPQADGVTTTEVPVMMVPTSGPGNQYDQQNNPTPGYREYHGKNHTDLEAYSTIMSIFTGGSSQAGAVLGAAAKKYTLSQVKVALKEVYRKLGIDGPLPRMKKGNMGSPQRGTTTRGYRLDNEGHPNSTNPNEKGPHFNYWDYTVGKRKTGKGVKNAVPIN